MKGTSRFFGQRKELKDINAARGKALISVRIFGEKLRHIYNTCKFICKYSGLIYKYSRKICKYAVLSSIIIARWRNQICTALFSLWLLYSLL